MQQIDVRDYLYVFFYILGEVAPFLFCWQLNQPHHGGSFDQVNYVIDIKLAHKVTAMHFDGPYGTVHYMGYFLVAFVADDQFQYFYFALGQRLASIRIIESALLQYRFNLPQKTFLVERFLDKIHSTCLNCRDSHWYIAVAGYN